MGVGAVANDQRHPTGGKGHRRRRQEDERQHRGREDSRRRHPLTLIAAILCLVCKTPLSIDTDVRDGRSERSQPEESQEGPTVVGEHREARRRRPGPLPGELTGGRRAWTP